MALLGNDRQQRQEADQRREQQPSCSSICNLQFNLAIPQVWVVNGPSLLDEDDGEVNVFVMEDAQSGLWFGDHVQSTEARRG